MLMSPVFGILSDRFGRLRVLGIAMTLVGLSSYPLFLLLNALPSITTLLLVQALVGVLIAASLGPIPAMLSEEFAGEMLHLGNEIKLVVPAEHAKRAAEILDGADVLPGFSFRLRDLLDRFPRQSLGEPDQRK